MEKSIGATDATCPRAFKGEIFMWHFWQGPMCAKNALNYGLDRLFSIFFFLKTTPFIFLSLFVLKKIYHSSDYKYNANLH